MDAISFESYQTALWGAISSPPGFLGNDGHLFSPANMLHAVAHGNTLIIVVKPYPSKKLRRRNVGFGYLGGATDLSAELIGLMKVHQTLRIKSGMHGLFSTRGRFVFFEGIFVLLR